MKFFARFFATRPDFSKPDSVLPLDPDSPEFLAAMTLSPAQRKAFYAVVRSAGAHLPAATLKRLVDGYRASASQGGSAAEVLAAGFDDDDALQALAQRVWLTAEPGRLREAHDEMRAYLQALGLADELPSEVAAARDVEAALAAFAATLRAQGRDVGFVEAAGEAFLMLSAPAGQWAALQAQAMACGLELRPA